MRVLNVGTLYKEGYRVFFLTNYFCEAGLETVLYSFLEFNATFIVLNKNFI